MIFKVLYTIGKARELNRVALSAIGLNRWRVPDQLTNCLLGLADLVGFESCPVEYRIDRDVLPTGNTVAGEIPDDFGLIFLFCYVFSPLCRPLLLRV